MIYLRDLIKQINPYLSRQEFLAIVGPRQSGKTIFLEIIKSHLTQKLKVNPQSIHIITFEDRRLLAEFTSAPIEFIRSYNTKHPITQKFTDLYLYPS
jgi:predicted AAA+ superfamily ATPase